MSIDKITKKPVLKETIPPAISADVSTPPPPTEQIVVVPEEVSTKDLLQKISNELASWKDYYTIVSAQTNNLVTNIGASAIITSKDLSDWFNTGDTRFPEAIDQWEEYYWNQPNSFFALIQSICDAVIQDLEYSADIISNRLFSNNYLKPEIIEVETIRINSAASLRGKLQKVEESTKKKLEECFIRRTIATLVQSARTKGFSSPPAISTKELYNISETAKNLRKVLRYASLSKYVDWKKTRKNIENRVMQLATQALLNEAVYVVGQLYSSISSPVLSFIESFQEMSYSEFCGAFDEGIQIILEQIEEVENKYINYIYQYEQQIISKYDAYSNLVALVDKKTTLDKQIQLMDRILQVIENISSPGNLEDTIISEVLKFPEYSVIYTT